MTAVFVSYRSVDSIAQAGRLATVLEHALGRERVHFASQSIEPGGHWPDWIKNRLADARVVLVVVGPNWLRAANEWGERFMDMPGDWVCLEVETALSSHKAVIPLLTGGARLPPRDRLPGSIAELCSRQAIDVRDAYFDQDLRPVLDQIAAAGRTYGRALIDNIYPIPGEERPAPASEEQIRGALGDGLASWTVVESPLPETQGATRVELHRSFSFRTFSGAVSFMNEVAPLCDIANHHPRWENIWRTLRVNFTTFDIGHQISALDIQLAKSIELAYAEFPDAAP